MSARTHREGYLTRRFLGRLALAASFACALPGCPLSDEYFVDAALGGTSAGGATAGRGAPPPPGGKAGDSGGREAMGGREATGGKETTAGSSAIAGGGMGGAACMSTTEVCDGADNDCDGYVDEDGVCPAECTARVFGDHTYLLCLPDKDDRLQHLQATQRCTAFTQQDDLAVPSDLELVRVETRGENDFLKKWLRSATTESGLIWNGASDVREETIWVWGRGLDVEVQFFTGNGSGGTPYMGAFDDFAPGEPHGGRLDGIDCGAFDSSVDFQWVDADCLLEPMGYICESEE